VTAEPVPEVSRAVGRLVSHAYKAAYRLAHDTERATQITEILDRATGELEDLLRREPAADA